MFHDARPIMLASGICVDRVSTTIVASTPNTVSWTVWLRSRLDFLILKRLHYAYWMHQTTPLALQYNRAQACFTLSRRMVDCFAVFAAGWALRLSS